MDLTIRSVFSTAFAPYGRVLEGYDLKTLLNALKTTEKPSNGTVYVPSDPLLEGSDAFSALQDGFYGGMPIQIGYCNGSNTKLNCLEYHRDSEINVLGDDIVLLVAPLQKIDGNTLDTARVEAFFAPAGIAVELYATTLHYAPCDAHETAGFRVAIVLPRGTNTEKPLNFPQNAENEGLWAKNKWLLAHPDSPEAKMGAKTGLTGPNIDISELIKEKSI